MSHSGGTRILVVDDEVDVAETYASQLRDRYDVEVAYSGEAALAALDESVDIVLLDREMPGLSGCEVLTAIRKHGLGTRVAMVTGEEPDFDIIEMPFDDYLAKPVPQAALFRTVERLQRCVTYDERLQEYYSLTAKRSALMASKSKAEREASPAFQTLEREIDSVRDSLDELVSGFDTGDFERAFRDVERPAETPAVE